MLNLSNITLVAVDCKQPETAEKALLVSQRGIKFKDVLLLTDKDSVPKVENKESSFEIFEIPKITSLAEYSTFVAKKLHEYIETPYAMVCQWDGFVINPSMWHEEFLNYDYIGAPWYYWDRFNVGNGGFSLRSKRFLELGKEMNIPDGIEREDEYLLRDCGLQLEQLGIQVAPEDLAIKFSFERNFKYFHPMYPCFGFHGINTIPEITAILNGGK